MKVALSGTGLIGGSVGLALKAKVPGVVVVAYDRDPSAAAGAVARGAADEATADAADAARDADFVFVATPVGVISKVVADLSNALKPGSLVTDVGSTKSRVVLDVESFLSKGVSFVGGHPMAGSEDEGIEAARADLFQDAWWILTPTAASEAAAYQRLHALLTTLGARVMALHPAEHDELMAVISHVPQLTATALMNMAADRGKEHAGLLALAAGGFRDVTRVAASNPEIWLDICRENADAIADALEHFAGRLLHIRDLVKQGEAEALKDELLRARESRRGLPGKTVEGDLVEVRIRVPDRPGLLAEITTAVGNLGVNIEDLQITHATEGGRGTLHLQVIGQPAADRVVLELQGRGLEARAVSA